MAAAAAAAAKLHPAAAGARAAQWTRSANERLLNPPSPAPRTCEQRLLRFEWPPTPLALDWLRSPSWARPHQQQASSAASGRLQFHSPVALNSNFLAPVRRSQPPAGLADCLARLQSREPRAQARPSTRTRTQTRTRLRGQAAQSGPEEADLPIRLLRAYLSALSSN